MAKKWHEVDMNNSKNQSYYRKAKNEDLADLYENKTTKLFIPITTQDTPGQANNVYSHAELRDGVQDDVSASTVVPNDFVSLVSVKVLVWSYSTGNVRYAGNGELASEGQSVWEHDNPIDSFTSSVIAEAETFYALNITSAFSAMAIGDFVGIHITRIGDHEEDTLADTVFILGFIIEYIASVEK